MSAIKKPILGRVQRKYSIVLENQSLHILAKNTGVLNIYITPELYRDANAKRSFLL